MSGWGLSATKSRRRWRPWPSFQDPPWRDNIFITSIIILLVSINLPTGICQVSRKNVLNIQQKNDMKKVVRPILTNLDVHFVYLEIWGTLF